MNLQHLHKFFFFIIIVLLSFTSCKDKLVEIDIEDPNVPTNPFDTVNYDPVVFLSQTLDSTTFPGIHHYILSESCNRPGCHDGTFEPDFRTVQSSYNTLVKHEINKNYPVDPIPYRITPGEPESSMMWRRITEHNPPNFELMPSSGDPLPARQLEIIENWILAGAPDLFGNLSDEVNLSPVSTGLVAFLPESNDERVDDNRNSTYKPFTAPFGENIELWFGVVDDVNLIDLQEDVFNALGNLKEGNTLSYNKMMLSDNPYNFNNAVEFDLDVSPFPEFYTSFYSDPFPLQIPYYQNITFNPADHGFEQGDLVFMRFYVQDNDHPTPTEIPTTSSQQFLQTYFSFYIQ